MNPTVFSKYLKRDSVAISLVVIRRVVLFFIVGTFHINAGSEPLPVITLHYYERPPFHYRAADGSMAGIIASSTESIFKRAGITYRWELTPVNRILADLKNNNRMDCSPGWYKTAEREAYAQFSLPIYHDLPLQGLSRNDFPAPEGITAKDLFLRHDLRLLLKQNFSQGAYMDALISTMPTQQVQQVTVEVPTMVKMIKANRADLIITTEEETDYFIAQSGYQKQDFRILKFPDVKATEYRYILCSRQVPAQIINRLNDAIRSAGTNK
jgi:polar amino acid transport system substrate-binding protein